MFSLYALLVPKTAACPYFALQLRKAMCYNYKEVAR